MRRGRGRPEVVGEEVEAADGAPVEGQVREVGRRARGDDEAEVVAGREPRVGEGAEDDRLRGHGEHVLFRVGEAVWWRPRR